jgi:ribosome-associated protein
MKSKTNASLAVAKLCCSALDEKKAGDLQLLDVSEQSSITNYLVLATATSEPHLRALRVELEKALDAAKVHIVGMEAGAGSGWIVVDAFDVMVHLFSGDRRSQYGLENLWKDAVQVSVVKLLAPAPAKKSPARAAKRSRK